MVTEPLSAPAVDQPWTRYQAIHSLSAEPIRNTFWTKSNRRSNSERWDSAHLRVFVNRDFRNGEHRRQLCSCDRTAKLGYAIGQGGRLAPPFELDFANHNSVSRDPRIRGRSRASQRVALIASPCERSSLLMLVAMPPCSLQAGFGFLVPTSFPPMLPVTTSIRTPPAPDLLQTTEGVMAIHMGYSPFVPSTVSRIMVIFLRVRHSSHFATNIV